MLGTLLQIENLCVRLPGSTEPAVRDVSLSIKRGERTAILGESGCGKSLTALALFRLLPSDMVVTGTAWFEGRLDLLRLPDKELRALRGCEIVLIPQGGMTYLNPVLSVGYQIAEALRRVGERESAAVRARILELLARVGLPDPPRIARMYPHELSGGMAQRVLLAAGMAGQPALVVADEPTRGLDEDVKMGYVALLKEVYREAGVLLITHDFQVAAACESLIVMYAGEIVEAGPTEAILSHPTHPYTASLVPRCHRTDCSRSPASRHLCAICPLVTVSTPGVAWQIRSAPGQFRRRSAGTASCGGAFLLEVRGVSKAFRRGYFLPPHMVLRGVTLSVERGEAVGIVGPSGSGKSTLARIIAGLLPADDGEVWLDGQPAAYRTLAERRRVQMIFQQPTLALDPRQRIVDAVVEPLLYHRLARTYQQAIERARELFALVGLHEELLSRRPSQISGGQAQRVVIARALALEPALLVADEPIAMLDASIQAQIIQLLRKLQTMAGVAVLLISHDRPLVRAFCSRYLVLKRGVIIAE